MTLTNAQKDYRAQKMAVRIRERMKTRKLSQVEVARRAGISFTTFQNAVLKYATRDPDLVRLGNMSIALDWPVQYLSGVLDGTYDLSDDPDNLPEPEPPVKRKWKKPTVVAPQSDEPEEQPARGGLRRDLDALETRVAYLEELVAFLASELNLKRRAS